MLPTLTNECSQFLRASTGLPLIKTLPSAGHGFRKVKVRHQKRANSEFVQTFNSAFVRERTNLLQRSVIARGASRAAPPDGDGREPFYIFPIDGFRYMYCANPDVTTEAYKATLDRLKNAVGDAGSEVFQDLLKFHYEFDHLSKGIAGGSEIILFNIPYYWAIRVSLVQDYDEFFYS